MQMGLLVLFIFNPRRHWLFCVLRRHKGGGTRPPRVWLLIQVELRDKNERVARHERKPKMPNFKVSGQPVTSGQVKHSPWAV